MDLRRFFPWFLLLALSACSSGPAVIPPGLTPAELVQRAQEASDRNRYKESLRYYEAIIDRFPTNREYLCAAEYEIAFIHYKQREFDLSRSEFNSLLARYEDPDAEFLPQQYKILSQKVLDVMTEKENNRSAFRKWLDERKSKKAEAAETEEKSPL